MESEMEDDFGDEILNIFIGKSNFSNLTEPKLAYSMKITHIFDVVFKIIQLVRYD